MCFFVLTILELYKVNDNQASLIELPEKYKNNRSIIVIRIEDQFCFCGVSELIFTQLLIIKIEPQNMLCIRPSLSVEELEIPVKVKDIPKLERMKNLNINIFQVNKTVPSQVYRANITYNHK